MDQRTRVSCPVFGQNQSRFGQPMVFGKNPKICGPFAVLENIGHSGRRSLLQPPGLLERFMQRCPHLSGNFSFARKAFCSSRVDSFFGCCAGSANWRRWRVAGSSSPLEGTTRPPARWPKSDASQDVHDTSTIKKDVFSLCIRVEPQVNNNALAPFHPSEPSDATAQNRRLFHQSAAHFQGAIGLTD